MLINQLITVNQLTKFVNLKWSSYNESEYVNDQVAGLALVT